MTHPPPGQPSRVAPGEIADLLDQLRQLAPGSAPSARLVYLDRKADLLTRIAADLGTAEARAVAAAARVQAAALRAEAEVTS